MFSAFLSSEECISLCWEPRRGRGRCKLFKHGPTRCWFRSFRGICRHWGIYAAFAAFYHLNRTWMWIFHDRGEESTLCIEWYDNRVQLRVWVCSQDWGAQRITEDSRRIDKSGLGLQVKYSRGNNTVLKGFIAFCSSPQSAHLPWETN